MRVINASGQFPQYIRIGSSLRLGVFALKMFLTFDHHFVIADIS